MPTIVKKHHGEEKEVSGTLEELIEYFGYTLLAGHSYNRSVNEHPKTVASLVSNLNKAVGVLQQGSYDPDRYRLKNPGAAWHGRMLDADQSQRDLYKKGTGDWKFYDGRVSGEGRALNYSQKYGLPNPIRKHAKQSSGLLTLVIAGAAIWWLAKKK